MAVELESVKWTVDRFDNWSNETSVITWSYFGVDFSMADGNRDTGRMCVDFFVPARLAITARQIVLTDMTPFSIDKKICHNLATLMLLFVWAAEKPSRAF